MARRQWFPSSRRIRTNASILTSYDFGRERERERRVFVSLRGLTFFREMETTNGNGREKDEGGKEEAAPLIKVNDVRSKLCAKHDGKIAINIARRKPR